MGNRIIEIEMEQLSDEKLMEIIGNQKDSRGMRALDYLYKRYSKPMHNFFYFTLNNDNAKAEDFLHDLFLKILEKNSRFDSAQSFKSWVYRVATNMCKNHFRTYQVVKKYNQHIIKNTSEISEELNSVANIKDAINNLESDYRSLIVLRFKMNLSIKEIAQVYECPEGTVKSRLFYATKELSKQVKQNEL